MSGLLWGLDFYSSVFSSWYSSFRGPFLRSPAIETNPNKVAPLTEQTFPLPKTGRVRETMKFCRLYQNMTRIVIEFPLACHLPFPAARTLLNVYPEELQQKLTGG